LSNQPGNIFYEKITQAFHRSYSYAASFIFSSCQKSIQEPTGVNVSLKETQQEEQTSVNSANSSEATQLSGIGYFDANDECNAAGQGADLAFKFTGDLNGC
jgi:hypothetical protein